MINLIPLPWKIGGAAAIGVLIMAAIWWRLDLAYERGLTAGDARTEKVWRKINADALSEAQERSAQEMAAAMSRQRDALVRAATAREQAMAKSLEQKNARLKALKENSNEALDRCLGTDLPAEYLNRLPNVTLG
ncbi:hypothetical protein FF098_014885 [Parvularcula flava]|uniref:Uncharacterized protein n=1 Tax=Aquisalinus luteolus TaxID=1566827 RepID=A0A8J3ES56_9PROT|nr:hypothetical protein [Aquisalinus luteolus]NHK29204.1 hypothetical protein [Aquisalinus luteolus]GGH99978.1 hypothetical protein GCM10011355_27190 [Aquisalinus luteolus]